MKPKLHPMKAVAALLAMAAIGGLALAGCGSHFTTQEAYEACNELLSESPSKDDSEVFLDCVACHEDCGSDCNEAATSPVSFTCPDEEGAGGAGGGS